jgi:hypothetical protein
MIIEIVQRIGQPPLRINASQLIIRGDGGTPLCVAGEYGVQGAVRIARACDGEEFDRTLRALGYRGPEVNIHTLEHTHP